MDKKEYAKRKGMWMILLFICVFLAGSVVNLSNALDEVKAQNNELSVKISMLEYKVKEASKVSKANREDVDKATSRIKSLDQYMKSYHFHPITQKTGYVTDIIEGEKTRFIIDEVGFLPGTAGCYYVRNILKEEDKYEDCGEHMPNGYILLDDSTNLTELVVSDQCRFNFYKGSTGIRREDVGLEDIVLKSEVMGEDMYNFYIVEGEIIMIGEQYIP